MSDDAKVFAKKNGEEDFQRVEAFWIWFGDVMKLKMTG